MTELQRHIEAALSRSVCGGWDRGFLESVLEQIAKGKTLTVKQKQTLGKVLARNDKAAQTLHDNWSSVYETEYKQSALVLAAYHTHQPYYKPMAADILANKVPERGKFLRMYENKYSKKVLLQHAATPKYKAGDYVRPRSSFDPYRHVEQPTQIAWPTQNSVTKNFLKRGGFILSVLADIRSCAKGAKRYKILPVGATMPVIVEERFIKISR